MNKRPSKPSNSSHVYGEIKRLRERYQSKTYKPLFIDDETRVQLDWLQLTEKAAANLNVRNGRFNDPLYEIAHRCEQMLYMGGCKFPKLSEATDFLTTPD